ncbi:MAG TPA: hypothetical protein PKD53_23190 [Chloroflexaceae bacterium]|nr:hypothetical protein [Chloroflexaceae bacterium]
MVELTLAGRQPAHPPFATLLLDARLANEGAAARWFLLPNLHEPATRSIGGGVFAAECYALAGSGRAVLCLLLGVGGAQALLLPPGGELLVRNLAVKHVSGAEPEALELATAADLLFGDEPAGAWLGLDPTCDPRAEVDAAERRMLGSRRTPDLASLTLALVEAERQTVAIAPASRGRQ